MVALPADGDAAQAEKGKRSVTKEECIIKACQVIRKRVRFDGASIRLLTTPFPGDDTKAIREATRLYVESWIVPLLDSIESGDMTRIREFYEYEKGHEMKPSNPTPHKCPVCNGTGYTSRPLGVAGDIPHWVSTSACHTCHPCKGSGIIWSNAENTSTTSQK